MLAHSLQQGSDEADERLRDRRRAPAQVAHLPAHYEEHVAVTANLGGEVRVARDLHPPLAFEQIALGHRQQALAYRQHRLVIGAARVTREQRACDGHHAEIVIEEWGTSGERVQR